MIQSCVSSCDFGISSQTLVGWRWTGSCYWPWLHSKWVGSGLRRREEVAASSGGGPGEGGQEVPPDRRRRRHLRGCRLRSTSTGERDREVVEPASPTSAHHPRGHRHPGVRLIRRLSSPPWRRIFVVVIICPPTSSRRYSRRRPCPDMLPQSRWRPDLAWGLGEWGRRGRVEAEEGPRRHRGVGQA